MNQQNAQILFPVNVPGAFDYAVPDGLIVDRGDIVFAPIGKQMKLGVVMRLGAAEEGRELKEIAEVKATPPLPGAMLDFVEWVARYNVASPGQVLRMVLRSWKALTGRKLFSRQTNKKTCSYNQVYWKRKMRCIWSVFIRVLFSAFPDRQSCA